MAKATFGGGCFWCTEAVYAQIKGVESVVSGYIGGQVENPTYKQVCSGLTGHAEAVEITYDPAVVPYEKLLDRSAIFYHDDEQKKVAQQVIIRLNAAKVFPSKIVTTLEPATVFYPAEDYHQDYFALNGFQPYCQAVIAPKVTKVRKVFKELLKDE
ncbi:MAG: peptide-methionine (S)-S-oxide reductase [Planctomycetia bacterium]|nr:peptide-methionine (S)-S-oxide reductase [Planctomycetia bacterium]